ncbi:zinc finger BED domain-containing protein RICESLEEPER 2-like [Rosa sericea]
MTSDSSPVGHELVAECAAPTEEETNQTISASEEEEETTAAGPRGKKRKCDRTPKVSKRKREKKAAIRSEVWEHFTKFDQPLIEVVDGVETVVGSTKRAQCKYCPTHLACDSRENGTSSLRKHIELICKGYPGRVDLEEGQQILSTDMVDGKPSLTSRTWSQDACVDAATRMIVIDELPFSAIERPGFRHFCEVAVPRFEVPCRKVIVKNFLRMYEAKKSELKAELQSHCVCLTTDTWTSCQTINYMVITAHFIDYGWKMHKRVLKFCVIPNHHGNTIGKILENALIEWTIDRVLTISVDNAAANGVAIEYVRKKMLTWDRKPICGGKFMHVRCLAHIVNLIVRSGLHIMERSVASIRNAIRYVRSSQARTDAFKVCMEQTKVECKKICILDVPTRWNSTYLMLDTALELRKAFDRMAEDEDVKYKSYFDEEEELEEEEDDQVVHRSRTPRKRVGPPKDEDWEKAEIFVNFLRVFYQVTVNVSASLHPTSQLAFHDIVAIKAEIDDLFCKPIDGESTETDKLLFQMANKMRKKYSKYFDQLDDINQLFLVAVVLDPRYKLRYFEFNCDNMLGLDRSEIKRRSDDVKELLVNLCDLYAASMGAQGSQKSRSGESTAMVTSSSSKSQKTKGRVTGKRKVMLEDWNRQLEEGDQMVVGHEVDRYLLDPIEKPKEGEDWKILLWWKLNGSKYPNLQALARDVLAIQVSTVASESSFSTGKRVIDPYRSSLTPKSVEALICLQNWLKSDSIMGLEYIPTIEEMEFYEKVEQEQADEERKRKEQAQNASASKTARDSKAAKISKTSDATKSSKISKTSDATKSSKTSKLSKSKK